MMKSMTFALAASATLAAACSSAPANEAQAREPAQAAKASPSASASQPVVVELFQSQGCSSCPPANRNVNAIAGDPGVLALNFSVTYWDRLGWKDTFGKQAFTDRQWEYAHAGGRAKVYTPQVIINGRTAIVGSNPQQLASEIRKAGGLKGPAIKAVNGKVSIAAGKTAKPATVWLVRYDPRELDVPIKAGENGGKTLPHKNIVRDLSKIGQWTGSAASFSVPVSSNSAYRSAILVQSADGGPMISARKL
ncbi:DUF1223 domain-containing protein [Novosphingopyxis sp.]|uniref:DUF1223 domain-containing protein n=1 Tax=Novosphingopyxis sp. TaxID=2709690 RepID=UPI003B596BAD